MDLDSINRPDTTQLASVKVSSECIILKLVMFQSSFIILKFIKNEIPFSIHRIAFSWPLSASASLVLCHFGTWLFGLICCQAQGQHIGPPTDDWK